MTRPLFPTVFCIVALSILAPQANAVQEIKPFVSGSYQKIISARQGKPFIVSFWSLTCSYCMTELDMLRKLSKKHRGLDLVLVSTDTPEEERDITATLAKLSLSDAEAWVFADSYTERLRFEVDRKWMGELPQTYLFGANGHAKAISGEVEEKEVERWIKEQYSLRP